MSKTPIVFCVDDWEVARGWLKYAIEKLREHLGDEVEVFVITTDSTEFGNGVKTINASKFIKDYCLSVTEKRQWHNRPASPMMMMRMFIPYIPELKNYTKVLYMDVDTEIVDKRFGNILGLTPDEETDVLGVIDCATSASMQRTVCHRCMRFLYHHGLHTGFPYNYAALGRGLYINSGVMLMNLVSLRKRFQSPDFIAYLVGLAADYKRDEFYDQDIINSVYRVKAIPSSFNTFSVSHIVGEPVFCLHHVSSGKLYHYPVLTKEQFVK